METEFDAPERRLDAAALEQRARLRAEELAAAGETLHPVRAVRRDLARNFWGRAWCRHLNRFEDYAGRLPRARSYLRHGAVLDLRATPGEIQARVLGRELYQVRIRVEPLAPARWEQLKCDLTGSIGSALELLRGKLPEEAIARLCDPEQGVLPEPGEIRFDCNCLDWADCCKHAAAALYGFGIRLDEDPALLFTLRGVDPRALLAAPVAGLQTESAPLDVNELGAIFGIELENPE